MAVAAYFKKSVSLKKQFFIFGLLSIMLSFVLSIILISITGIMLSPLRAAASIEAFVETKKEEVLNNNFKLEMDKHISENYWVLSKDKGILYSNTDEVLETSIKVQAATYSEKIMNKNTGEIYRIIFKPLIINGQLKGGLVFKCKNSFLLNSNLMYKLIEKSNSDSIINLFMLAPALLISPIIVILFFSLLLSKNINEPLEKIISWSEKIKNNDLNFKVDSSYNNELGKVMEAFEDMRAALESSLKTQWIMTKQRKDMILSLTHDIKTPITVICGHLELITGDYVNIDDETKERSLNIVMNNANRVKRLINELNEVWDLEKPNFQLNLQNINIVEFLNEIYDNFSYTCSEKKVTLTLSHNFKEEDCFSFDAFRIDEVLENLVSNSLRFTPKGGNITIECFIEGDSLVFEVVDTGKGFSEKGIKDIFKMFYKGRMDENKSSNCGLGMYICKLIVDKHKGEIKAYNHSKGGAVVEFSIKDNVQAV